ncbi:MAG: hypothetical protein ACR5K9_03810 [Wolbachia sp.]
MTEIQAAPICHPSSPLLVIPVPFSCHPSSPLFVIPVLDTGFP